MIHIFDYFVQEKKDLQLHNVSEPLPKGKISHLRPHVKNGENVPLSN